MKPVKLRDLIDEMDILSDDDHKYINKVTGEIITVSSEDLNIAEESEPDEDFAEYPDWQRESILQALDVVEKFGSKYISLPEKWDIHEYRIMEDFCLSVENQKISNTLYNAIKGRGAFQRFKDTIHRFGIQDDWYRFYEAALKRIAIEWCEMHGIKYQE